MSFLRIGLVFMLIIVTVFVIYLFPGESKQRDMAVDSKLDIVEHTNDETRLNLNAENKLNNSTVKLPFVTQPEPSQDLAAAEMPLPFSDFWQADDTARNRLLEQDYVVALMSDNKKRQYVTLGEKHFSDLVLKDTFELQGENGEVILSAVVDEVETLNGGGTQIIMSDNEGNLAGSIAILEDGVIDAMFYTHGMDYYLFLYETDGWLMKASDMVPATPE